ncbi:MAG: hypothetical protein KDC09_15300 [Bacteroidales bacterium]|nr:hypothetical protein [Bacteroidales bacterium]
MEQLKTIETFGTIMKKEILASLEEEFCAGALVLESKFPFPGYYHDTIPDKKVLNPGSIFLVTKIQHQEEDIMRTNHEVKKIFKKKFDATVGQVVVFNETRPCIRVKFLDDYNFVPELVELYKQSGIQFLKFRKVKPYYNLIKIRKYFVLETTEPGIYCDANEKQMCYLQIPGNFTWNQFEKTTLDLKRNLDNDQFDAAMGTIYRQNCLVDMVRIYTEKINMDELRMLQKKYVEAVKKLKQ